jgi:hypothetical protein
MRVARSSTDIRQRPGTVRCHVVAGVGRCVGEVAVEGPNLGHRGASADHPNATPRLHRGHVEQDRRRRSSPASAAVRRVCGRHQPRRRCCRAADEPLTGRPRIAELPEARRVVRVRGPPCLAVEPRPLPRSAPQWICSVELGSVSTATSVSRTLARTAVFTFEQCLSAVQTVDFGRPRLATIVGPCPCLRV